MEGRCETPLSSWKKIQAFSGGLCTWSCPVPIGSRSDGLAIGYRRDGRRSRLFFQTREGSYNTESLIAFLDDLKRHVRRQKAILVWDGLPAHKSRAMQAYLLRQRGWLTVERLPGYAPDLNPIETMWGNIKGQELANRCAQDLVELDTAVRGGMSRVKQSRTLPFSFLKHAGLSL